MKLHKDLVLKARDLLLKGIEVREYWLKTTFDEIYEECRAIAPDFVRMLKGSGPRKFEIGPPPVFEVQYPICEVSISGYNIRVMGPAGPPKEYSSSQEGELEQRLTAELARLPIEE